MDERRIRAAILAWLPQCRDEMREILERQSVAHECDWLDRMARKLAKAVVDAERRRAADEPPRPS